MSHYSEQREKYYDYLPPRPEYRPESWQEILRDLEKGKAGLNVGLLYDVIILLVASKDIGERLSHKD